MTSPSTPASSTPTPSAAPAAADQPLFIAGAAGRIEAALDHPDADPRPLLAIICHPLPTEGGSMHNKVVTMTARALRESGATTLRFNFRGVGQSEGAFDDGDGELDDLRAVADWAMAQHPEKVLWLAGFSFGAWISLRAADQLKAQLLLLIAPPVGRSWSFDDIALPACPWLVIQGDDDEVVDAQAVHTWIESLPMPPQLVRMPGAGHFFHRKLIDLRGAVKNGVSTWLPPATSANA
ncbi:MAG: alpha/beta fold hydrolase [Thermomonas sp.]